MKKLVNDLITSNNDYYDKSKPADDIGKNITLGLYILYAVSIGAAVLSYIGIIFLCCGKLSARGCVHIAWCLYCIIMIIGFALASVLHPVNGVIIDSCDYADRVLTIKTEMKNQTLMQRILMIFISKVTDKFEM